MNAAVHTGSIKPSPVSQFQLNNTSTQPITSKDFVTKTGKSAFSLVNFNMKKLNF